MSLVNLFMCLNLLMHVQREEEGDEPFGFQDFRYYIRKAEEMEFKVDYETVKQYFPLNVVTAGLLQIYQDLLGLMLLLCFFVSIS